ncbi:MAG: Fe-S cluster assembly protein SufD [Anaerolineaceae bacterium]
MRTQTIIDNKDFPGLLHLDLGDLTVPSQLPLVDYHQAAWKLAQTLPFPSKKDDSWRRTDLSGLVFEQLKPAGSASGKVASRVKRSYDAVNSTGEFSGRLLVAGSQVYQQVNPEVESRGVIFTDFRTAETQYPGLVSSLVGRVIPPSDGKFAAMASALGRGGVFIYIPHNTSLEAPFFVQLAAGASGSASFTHTILWLEDGAACQVVLEFITKGTNEGEPSLHTGLVEIHLGEHASLHLFESQEFGTQIWNITHERAQLQRDAHLEWICGSLGAHFSKNFLNTDLLAPGAEAQVNGFYFTDADQRLDLDTQQNHLAPQTTSNLLFKGAVAGKSKAVWEGMIYVAPNALKTDGYQSNRNLILSDEAEISAIPGLEILADDVRCSHGASVGRVDDEELFYLQSRGIPLAEAEQLIVEGFFAGVVEKVQIPSLQESLKKKIRQKLTKSAN